MRGNCGSARVLQKRLEHRLPRFLRAASARCGKRGAGEACASRVRGVHAVQQNGACGGRALFASLQGAGRAVPVAGVQTAWWARVLLHALHARAALARADCCGGRLEERQLIMKKSARQNRRRHAVCQQSQQMVHCADRAACTLRTHGTKSTR